MWSSGLRTNTGLLNRRIVDLACLDFKSKEKPTTHFALIISLNIQYIHKYDCWLVISRLVQLLCTELKQKAGAVYLLCSSERRTLSVLIMQRRAADAIIVAGERRGGEQGVGVSGREEGGVSTAACCANSTCASQFAGRLKWRHVALICTACILWSFAGTLR